MKSVMEAMIVAGEHAGEVCRGLERLNPILRMSAKSRPMSFADAVVGAKPEPVGTVDYRLVCLHVESDEWWFYVPVEWPQEREAKGILNGLWDLASKGTVTP